MSNLRNAHVALSSLGVKGHTKGIGAKYVASVVITLPIWAHINDAISWPLRQRSTLVGERRQEAY